MPFAGTWEPGTLDFAGSGATQKTPLRANGLAELLPDSGEQVHVTGHVATELETDCDRCLGRAAYPVDTDFDLYYKPASSVNTEEGEVAIDEGEAEIGFYELPGLELEQILTEQVLLQLPMQRVCSESCKGICPTCGVNRNETECQCSAAKGNPTEDTRWQGLKDIRV